jgi:uncharacterized membrane protein
MSVDVLRGLAMVVMALDHTRDWFSSSAALFDPTDLSRTTPILFFTRWATHFCAPVFVFLAGSGAYLFFARSQNKGGLARFLATRGAWLILLEVFVISPIGWSFSFSFAFTRLQVIWVIGVSMLVLSVAVLLLPSRVIGFVGVAMIFVHDVFDGAHEVWLGSARSLHQVAFFQPLPHKIVGSVYPLIPWIGVMMAGYAAGELLTLEPRLRRRLLLWIGGSATLLFFALRTANLYGDPSPWSIQVTTVKTVLSLLRCSKYPPSLLYLLMTLGPSLLLLASIENSRNWLTKRLQIFGRVPLFYYILHLPLLHGIAVLFSFARYGRASFLCHDSFLFQRSANPLPAGYGYGLPVVYGVWVFVVLLLYPACRWYAEVKRTRGHPILRYL